MLKSKCQTWAFLLFDRSSGFPGSVTTRYRDQLKHHFQWKIQLNQDEFLDENFNLDEMNFQLKMMIQLVPVSHGNREVQGESGRHRCLPS